MKTMTDATLVLKLQIRMYGEHDTVALDKVAEHARLHIRDWRDGRYPFDVEQLEDGINRILKRAVYECVQSAMYKKYGNEMVPHDNGSTARWHLEADDILKDRPVDLSIRDLGEVAVEIIEGERWTP